MSNDLAISNVSYKPSAPPVYKNTPYIVLLAPTEPKSKSNTKFITTGKLDIVPGFIQVRGFFVELEDQEINSNYNDIISSVDKEKIVEIYFPNHRVISIRSLIYKAVR